MQITETQIPDVKIREPDHHSDNRAWLSAVWNPEALSAAGLDVSFMQDNLTHSPTVGVVRALHFQVPPYVQGKLISCLTGTIHDVAVVLLTGSPTFGHHIGIKLRAEDSRQLWVPHGYCTTEPDTLVFYKLTAPYRVDASGGVLWRDPALGISWPAAAGGAIVNARDDSWPILAALESPFRFDD